MSLSDPQRFNQIANKLKQLTNSDDYEVSEMAKMMLSVCDCGPGSAQTGYRYTCLLHRDALLADQEHRKAADESDGYM
jgi:hypothetical protein